MQWLPADDPRIPNLHIVSNISRLTKHKLKEKILMLAIIQTSC